MKKLTDKQKSFCEEYVANGYVGGKAYSLAFQNENLNSCRVGAHELLQKPVVIEKIKEIEGNYRILGMEMGIDRKRILGKIDEMLNAKKKTFQAGNLVDESPDNIAINNAIVTWAKLTGEFEAEKKSIVIGEETGLDKNPQEMTPEEIEVKKAEILKEMQD